MLEYPNTIRNILKLSGYNSTPPPYGIKKKGFLFLMLSIVMCLQIIHFISHNWNDLEKRFLSTEHFVVTLIITLVLVEYALSPSNIHNLLKLVEDDYFNYRLSILEDRQRLIDTSHKQINIGANGVYYLLMLEVVSLILSPILYLFYVGVFKKGYQNGNLSFKPQHLPLPMTSAYVCTNIYTYIALYIVQSVYLYVGVLIGFCVHASINFAMQNIATDEILLAISLKQIDQFYRNCKCIDGNWEMFAHQSNGRSEFRLQNIFNEVIEHHNTIYRKCRILNNNAGMTIIILNYTLTFLICLIAYCFVKATDTLTKCKYIIQGVPVIGLLYIYSLKGQNLINKGEMMNQQLAEISWVDKPEWFKKCLLIMLTRNKRRPELKPFGLHVVDLRNFAAVINAAYSYFNLFNRLS